MIALVLLIGLLLVIQGLMTARAEAATEGIDLNGLEALSREAGFDAAEYLKRLVDGSAALDGSFVRDALRQLVDALKAECADLLSKLAGPVLLGVLVGLFTGKASGAAGMPGLVCVGGCALILMTGFGASGASAREALDRARRTAEAVAPALGAAAAAGGMPSTSALMSVVAAQCVDIIEYALGTLGFGLCSAAASVAVAGSLSPRFRLEKLFCGIRALHHWLLGAVMLAFAGMTSGGSLMSAAADSAALKTAGTVIERVIPIIGGGLSDASGALSASAGVVRSALGLTGLALLIRLCAPPLLRLVTSMISLKLASAVIEPFAPVPLATLVDRFGDVIEMLFAMCLEACALSAVLVAAFLRVAGRL